MKLLRVVVFSFIVLGVSLVFAWERIVDCNNGSLVIDIGDNDPVGRPTYQLVVKGEPLSYFVSQNGILLSHVRNGEFVAPLSTYDSAFFASQTLTHTPPMTYLRQWVYVNKYNRSVRLRANREGRIGPGGEEVANWQFHNCWIR